MALLDKYRLMAESGKYSFRREFGEVDRVVFTYFEYDSRTGERIKTIKKNIDSKYLIIVHLLKMINLTSLNLNLNILIKQNNITDLGV